ncbi:MAG: hypothetical protein QOG53_3276 [Frankiales bacterium]|jgi:uncharacterized protein (DUF2236 family)|nr:hypothetical protein [Frankiales bacterium]
MTRADPGLFGPASVTWRVHGDPVLWIGGLRALLLQALHPAAMEGLARNADIRLDPWGRLMRTAGYVGTVTFGSTTQAEAAGAAVRRVHQRLDVDDPHLMRWVHSCLVDSFLTTARRAGTRLSADEADQYVDEQARCAPLVGVSAATVPHSVPELTTYFADIQPELHLTPAARDAARLVVLPPMPAWVQLATPARVGWTGVAALAVGLLPPWARRLYRLPGLPMTDLTAGAALRVLALGLRAVPARFRDRTRDAVKGERSA